jgi:oligoendopeptidase F
MAIPIQVDLQRSFPRKFVPNGADMGNWAEIEPLFTELLNRKVASAGEFERWLLDYSELSGALWEESNLRYIAMTSQTDDPARESAYQHFVQEITPRCKPLMDAMERAYLENPVHAALPKERYEVLDRKTNAHVALYREKNVELETQEELLAKDYYKVMGAITIPVDGKDLTPEQASKFLEEPDRALRQRVWEQIAAERLKHKEELDAIFDRLVLLRTEIAANAGFANYRDYMFPRRERFDYKPEDCFRFHEGVERAVVPLVRQMLTRRRKLLRVDSLRPWDTTVDPRNRHPLRPFSNTDAFLNGTREVFARVHPAFGEQFRFMTDQRLLDVESRKGKAPGGYQSHLSERRLPFIFMNAVGRDADLSTLMHEGGHAFHTLAARNEALIDYRDAPTEFAEVASMGMELLVTPHLGIFYPNPQDLHRAIRSRLESILTLLPMIAVGDAFQHWIYTHPAHTREERAGAWVDLYARFNPVTDWTGYEEQRAFNWHRILHFFTVPFYFIDYGIAQIGALQVWQRSRKNYNEAVERYWSALSLGGSRPLPELFAAAGAQFRFDYDALQPLMDAIEEQLSRLDEA